MLATALLFLLYFIFVSATYKKGGNRVLIETTQLPRQVIRETITEAPIAWQATSVPVTYEPSQLQCPNCASLVRLAHKQIDPGHVECPICGTVIKLAQRRG